MELLKKLRRRPSRLGLDIGANGTRVVQFDVAGDRCELLGVARVERSLARNVDDENEAALARRVAACVATGRFEGNRAAAALSSPDVVYHALELPANILAEDATEADRVVRWEIGRLTGESAESMDTTYWPLPKSSASAASAIGVAAPSSQVTRTIAACNGAGLHCQCVDTAAVALSRLVCMIARWSDQDVWGVLDLGYRQSRLVLCVDETPVLVRSAGSGGQAWTERIAEALGVSVSSAETHKRQHGINLTPRGSRRDDTAPPAIDLGGILLSALRSDLKALATEIKRSYEYVLGCYPERRAGDLVLVGGGASMNHLPEFLGESLGITVRRASSYIDSGDCRLCGVAEYGEMLESIALAAGLAIEP